MKCWSQTLCCLLALTCADCAGTIDDAASFESYASQERGGIARDATVEEDPDAALDAGTGEDASEGGEEQADAEPAPTPEVDAGDAPDGDAPDPATPGPAVSCDFQGLMMSKCGAASCHGGPSASTGLDLTSEGLRARMANVSGGGACSDKPMINADDPEQSTLYLVVTGNACGLRMPLGGQLSAAEQACVLEWISAAP